MKNRLWPKIKFVYYKRGNCWRFWHLYRTVLWSGGLTYYGWWKFGIVLDWRVNWFKDLIENHKDCEEQ